MRKTARWIAVVLALTLVAAACGDDNDSDDQTATGSADATTTTVADATDQGENVLAVDIGVADTPYGEVLTNSDGLALYFFDTDEGQDQPGCEGGCAEKWPAVITDAVDSVTLPDGVDVQVGLAERASGTMQVTIDGHPVYTMNGDEPGQALCQGGSGTWWVVNSDGTKNTTPPVTEGA